MDRVQASVCGTYADRGPGEAVCVVRGTGSGRAAVEPCPFREAQVKKGILLWNVMRTVWKLHQDERLLDHVHCVQLK